MGKKKRSSDRTIDLGKMTIRELFGTLTPGQICKIIGVIFGMFTLAFGAGKLYQRIQISLSLPSGSFNPEVYERLLKKQFDLEDRLRDREAYFKKREKHYKGAVAERAQEIKKLLNELSKITAERKNLEIMGNVLYQRLVDWKEPLPLRKGFEIVRLEDGDILVNEWSYLPSIHHIRRESGIRDPFLKPVFLPKDKVCRDGKCATVRQAFPGIIPFYQVIGEGSIGLAYWYESTLDPQQTFEHKNEYKTDRLTIVKVSRGIFIAVKGNLVPRGIGKYPHMGIDYSEKR